MKWMSVRRAKAFAFRQAQTSRRRLAVTRKLRARFKIRLGQVLSKGFCEHDGCETKRIQLI
jgi:hypothetical protein